MSEPGPGFDVIALTGPGPGALCSDRGHRGAGRQAAVVVTFGELGTRFRDDLWHESWHCSYPMCGDCWERTHRVARTSRPGLAAGPALAGAVGAPARACPGGSPVSPPGPRGGGGGIPWLT